MFGEAPTWLRSPNSNILCSINFFFPVFFLSNVSLLSNSLLVIAELFLFINYFFSTTRHFRTYVYLQNHKTV